MSSIAKVTPGYLENDKVVLPKSGMSENLNPLLWVWLIVDFRRGGHELYATISGEWGENMRICEWPFLGVR